MIRHTIWLFSDINNPQCLPRIVLCQNKMQNVCVEMRLGFGVLLETSAALSHSSTWASAFLSAYQGKHLAALHRQMSLSDR